MNDVAVYVNHEGYYKFAEVLAGWNWLVDLWNRRSEICFSSQVIGMQCE